MWRSKKDQKAIMDALMDVNLEGSVANRLDRLGNILTEIRDLLRQNRAQNTS